MAQGQIRKTKDDKPIKVCCSGCRYFVRDTDGISKRNGTNEYFMGICSKELNLDDTNGWLFADKLRYCETFKAEIKEK